VDVKDYRVVKVQPAGDYREAYLRFCAGGSETYYAQRYSVDSDAIIGERVGQMGVLCGRSAAAYDEVLGNGVRAMGAGLKSLGSGEEIIPLLERFAPTHLIVCMPSTPLLHWALQHGVRVLPMFATSFLPSYGGVWFGRRWVKRIRFKRYCMRLARLLNDPRIEWVANHNVPASLSLARIGVAERKIVPWDWIAAVTPQQYAAKAHPGVGRTWTVLVVGVVSEAKGVGDVIDAVALLRRRGADVKLKIIGAGNIDAISKRVDAIGGEFSQRVKFEGLMAHDAVIQSMREADVMVVASRHDYPEGLPCTMYEALATRTPLVCSDHPMFVRRMRAGETALIFHERDPADLARQIQRLMEEPQVYASLSGASAEAWEKLQVPVKYRELILRWIEDGPADRDWLRQHSLSEGQYVR
jgi:glycosyltransferase involved in cell wall biosynthesis